jgi:D-mannonate dehydratase
MPLEIEKMYPQYWIYVEEDERKNMYEEELLRSQFQRLRLDKRIHFERINSLKMGKKLVDNVNNLKNYDLTVVVYSFVDMLSHARTDMEMIRELANDEAAYRSLTSSWFEHSHLHEFMRECAARKFKMIITTDHGTVNVTNPIKVIGDRNTSTNLRYKMGKNLNYNPKEVFEVKRPDKVHLPSSNLSSSYIFAYNNDYMVYPNNYNQFVNFYRNTFQHGGISLEEMIIPLITLSSK